MQQLKEIHIGIQARSTSKRFPGKTLSKINNKTILEYIVENASSCMNDINRYSYANLMTVKVMVLCPYNDPIVEFCNSRKINCLEGPEDDVLARYNRLCFIANPDYVVRLTADCPLVPAYAIRKAIVIAVKNNYDYVSNVDPRFRTYPDGFDIEVVSRRAMDWANQKAVGQDREHVTSLLRKEDQTTGFKYGAIIGHIDHSKYSNTKLSIDDEDDLKIVEDHMKSIQSKVENVISLYGRGAAHRF